MNRHSTVNAATPNSVRLSARISGVLLDFWNGFVTPSALAFGLMLAVFVAGTAMVFLTVTPKMIAGPTGVYLPRSVSDNEGFVTREALQIAQSDGSATTVRPVYVISDSSLASAVADDRGVSAALNHLTGSDWKVWVLAIPAMSAIEEATLADVVTQRQPGVVVLAVGLDSFRYRSREELKFDALARLGIRSTWGDADTRAIGGTPRRVTGSYLIDNHIFLVRNVRVAVLRLLVGKPAERKIDSYLVGHTLSPDYIEKIRLTVLRELHAVRSPSDAGLAIIGNTIERLHERGASVVLVEKPISPALFATPEDRALYVDHLRLTTTLAGRLGVSYCNLSDTVHPSPTAFPDFIHIADPVVQVQMQKALARCIADHVALVARP